MAVKITADELYQKLKSVQPGTVLCSYTPESCEPLAQKINRINELKEEKNAVVLAHFYLEPEITLGVADFTGDSYKLSKDAMNTTADTIVFAAVRFMGETAKILNPNKKVLVPGSMPGCTLADSVTGDDVRRMREQYPEHAFLCYINTTADVKAECDACVTSSNVYDIVEKFPSDKIVFLPDYLMGQNVQEEMKKRGVQKDIVLYDGHCYVHKQYDPDLIDFFRMQNNKLKVVSHPECMPAVAMQSDYVGSTSQMISYIEDNSSDTVLLLTECGLTAMMQSRFPEKHFVGACSMCRYMKSNTLDNILQALESPTAQMLVDVDDDVLGKARQCIDEMFRYA